MKVEEIKIKKFKKLENIESEIKGHHILLLGDNGVGKTSVIQFLEIALGKQDNIPPNAEGLGEVVINKGGDLITFKVSFRDGKPVIKVKGPGIHIDNNKSAIAQLVGANSFDIEHFVNLSKTKAGRKEQVEDFKKRLPEEVRNDLARHEANVKNAYDERTEIGRDIDKLKGQIALHPLNALPDFELEKIEPVDTAEVMAQLKLMNEANEKIKSVEKGILDREEKISQKNSRINELKAEIEKINSEIEVLNKEVVDGKGWLKTHEKKDTAVIEKTIEDAADTNQKYNKAQELLKSRKNLETYQNEYGEKTALIDSTKEAIANAVKEFEGPIEGLGYEDDQLVYNGIPVHPDSLSKSEIMELGFRLKLAENPENILFIPEAESLGAERFMLLKELADKHGCQIIAEQVQRNMKELNITILTDELITQ